MKRSALAWGTLAIALVLLALLVLSAPRWGRKPEARPAGAPSPATAPQGPAAAREGETDVRGLLYGRITTVGGTVYEGRLRWGGGQEAYWSDTFNGSKRENPWVAHVPPDRRPRERRPIEVFGLEIARRERPMDLLRPFMARFGDIARIEARGRDVCVVFKSGSGFVLDRLEASDFDDGVRVWDGVRGAVHLDSLLIRTIEFLPSPSPGSAPSRLHGTVRARKGVFTGFVMWDREECSGSDELDGRTEGGALRLRFDSIRSIERRSREGSRVTLADGREMDLSGAGDVGPGNRGIYVEDRRYGRVLVPWDAFERVDFSPGGNGPEYDDFPPGRPLTGDVTTRSGERLTGRIVFDLDESETTETLDAPSGGVDYTIPLGLVASIVTAGGGGSGPAHAGVALWSGEVLAFERAGDLGEGNAGLLVFVEGRPSAEYVPWTDVERIELERPPSMYPPLDGR